MNKSGTMAVASTDFSTWSNDTVVVKPKQKRAPKKIKHDLFEYFSEMETDAYWITQFKTAAEGKFPKYFTYNGKILTHKNGNKCNSIELQSKDEDSLKLCKEFVKLHGGLFSALDELNSERYSIPEDEITWSGSKAKMKKNLVNKFIEDLTVKMNLDDDQVNQLTQTISVGISCGVFDKKNIITKDRRILEIKDLYFEDNLFKFKEPKNMKKTPQIKVIDTDITPDMIPKFSKIWGKKLESIIPKQKKKDQPKINDETEPEIDEIDNGLDIEDEIEDDEDIEDDL